MSKEEAEKVIQAKIALDQLLADMEDEAFWTDENWEENNNRDEKGFPVE